LRLVAIYPDRNGQYLSDTAFTSRIISVVGNDEDPPRPQCSDSVDNDHDELIDFPDDPGCTNGGDDVENDEPPGASNHRRPPPRTRSSAGPAIEVSANRRASRRFSGRLIAAAFAGHEGEYKAGRRGIRLRRWFGIVKLKGRLLRSARTRRRPRRYAALLDSTWIARSSARLRRNGLMTVSGVAIASFARVPGEACLRYTLRAPRNRPGRGRITVIGTSEGRRLPTRSAKFRFTSLGGRGTRVRGTLSKKRSRRRPLPPVCERLKLLGLG
jgi:hypothetical protein